MTYTENLWLFFTLLFGIIIVPGMDMVFVLANSLTGGRASGLSATAGIMAGGVLHTLYAALGVSVILHLVPGLFNVLLVAGAAYIAWIGFSLVRSSITIGGIEGSGKLSRWASFRQGALTSLMNPKAYLFMLAVYPQFLKPQFGPIWSQALVMAAMIATTQLAIYGGLALAAGRGRDFLVGSPGATMWIGRAAGVVLILVAAFTIWQGWAN
ncbi:MULTISPECIES: LysE family translocator [Sinorhizobium/Ensifer group]|uniref:LysE family translocator n=1 Tax=Sinorhizobium/Ensifer group TaxID=227292 RepID=UPI0007109A7C|nr:MULTISPECIES: LysE family translocator [Sinorhizobium/Ensifer group]KRD64165.1 threonine transporter RhtB [Ensifer sp. Root278]KSV95686.1 threonine transporter RhtB [Sinorhizobium sp. GL28]MBD9506089.1 LysE family translocator [Ensifer sp. ENS10]